MTVENHRQHKGNQNCERNHQNGIQQRVPNRTPDLRVREHPLIILQTDKNISLPEIPAFIKAQDQRLEHGKNIEDQEAYYGWRH